jgi:hypothetical protein
MPLLKSVIMIKQEYQVIINASPEKIWDVLWNESTYNKWTSVFSEESTVETDWKEGSRILFLDGKGNGMVSNIEVKKPNKQMSFRHLGMIENGKEDLDSDKVKEWAGAMENYWLEENNGHTLLKVDIELSEDWAEQFKEMWPRALQKLKELSEQK